MKIIKKKIKSVCLLGICTLFLVSAKASIVESKIEDVVVFQKGARIERTASFTLKPGNNELVFSKLSDAFNTNSVQVLINGRATILSVTPRLNYLQKPSESKEYRILSDSLELIKNEINWLIKQEQTYNSQLNLLENNKKLENGNLKVTASELSAWVEYFEKKQMALYKAMHKLEINKKNLNEVRARIEAQINQMRGQQGKRVGEVVVQMSSKQAEKINLKLSYLIHKAGWAPVYDLRSAGIGKLISLAYKANVYQSTGYNWENVNLTISTGNPGASQTSPVFYPWYIDYYQPMRSYKREMAKSAPAPSAIMFDDMAMAEVEELEEEIDVGYATAAPTTIAAQSALSATYEITAKQNIPSDGQQHMVSIQEHKLNAGYKFFAVPKLREDAFLLAELANYGELNLLPGNANIYYEGGYVGQAYINPQQADDTLQLSLGKSNNIAISHNVLKDKSGKQTIGGNIKVDKGFELVVYNKNNHSADVEILDQIPISRQKDIVVELIDGGGASYNSNTGQLKWNIEMAAGEKKVLKFSYSVKYPKDQQILGF